MVDALTRCKKSVFPLFVDYGQRSADARINACRKILWLFRWDLNIPGILRGSFGVKKAQISGNADVAFSLASIGLAYAAERNASLVICCRPDGGLFGRAVSAIRMISNSISFPFCDDPSFLSTLETVPNEMSRIACYTWHCDAPRRVDGIWEPCRECVDCVSTELHSNETVSKSGSNETAGKSPIDNPAE